METFLNRYLTDPRRNVKTKTICRITLKVLCDIPQGSILGPIFLYTNFFLSLTKSEIDNFTDKNFITATWGHSADPLNSFEAVFAQSGLGKAKEVKI